MLDPRGDRAAYIPALLNLNRSETWGRPANLGDLRGPLEVALHGCPNLPPNVSRRRSKGRRSRRRSRRRERRTCDGRLGQCCWHVTVPSIRAGAVVCSRLEVGQIRRYRDPPNGGRVVRRRGTRRNGVQMGQPAGLVTLSQLRRSCPKPPLTRRAGVELWRRRSVCQPRTCLRNRTLSGPCSPQ